MGMYETVLVLWVIWIPLQLVNSIPFDIFPISILAIYSTTFVFMTVNGLIRVNKKQSFLNDSIFPDRL